MTRLSRLIRWTVALMVSQPMGWLCAQVSPTGGIIDDCHYSNAIAAQAVWKPMRGSPLVALTNIGGATALRLACDFAGAQTERASWDRAVALDLNACRGVRFELFCRDATPVSYFSVYFQSGDGWYHASFYPELSNTWNTIELDKSAFGIEGQPAGWGKIRTLRLSAWRGLNRDTEMLVRDIRVTGTLGGDALVAIVRGDSVAQKSRDEARNVEQFSGLMAELLQSVGVDSAILSDVDLTAEQLRPARMVILPYNPQLPDRAAVALANYVNAGGRLMVFYSLPEKLRGVLRVQGGAHVREPRPGFFAAIRPDEQALPGAPAMAGQKSWNIHSVSPVPGASRVVAEWLDDQGRPSGHAAIIATSNTMFMSHVLLGDDPDNKRRLLLAMAGSLAPELWQRASQVSLARMGSVGARKDFDETATAITALATNKSRALQSLAEARVGRDAARKLVAERRFAEAMDQAAAASRHLR